MAGERWWGPVGRDTGRVVQVPAGRGSTGGGEGFGARPERTVPKRPKGVPVRAAVRFGAVTALVQTMTVLLMPVSGAWGAGVTVALLYLQLAAGPGVAHFWASGPRFSTASAGSTTRRRLVGAVTYAAWAGAVLLGLSMVVVGVLSIAAGAPWPVTHLAWYLLWAGAAAWTAYRRGSALPTSARTRAPARGTAVRPPRAGGPGREDVASVRRDGDVERAVQRDRDVKRPVQPDEDLERAVTEFGALLSVHPFRPSDPGVTYRQLADHSVALDAYERAKNAAAADVPGILAAGRAALDRLDRRLGLDAAVPGTGCFFDERHGPAVESVRWAPPGGAVRVVDVCRADAVRLADGELPGGR